MTPARRALVFKYYINISGVRCAELMLRMSDKKALKAVNVNSFRYFTFFKKVISLLYFNFSNQELIKFELLAIAYYDTSDT